jgi:hypothetical protein
MSQISKLNKAFDRVIQEAPCGKDLEVGKMKDALGLDIEDNVRDYGDPTAAAEALVDEFGKLEAAGMINGAANCSGDPFIVDMMNALEDIEA